MKTLLSFPLLLTALLTTIQADDTLLERCIVSVKREVEIPAQKDGVLIELPVIEGSVVEAGDVLAVIDDREVKAALKVAKNSLIAAEERASYDIEERYAKAATNVAKADLRKALEANRQVLNSVTDIEIMEKELVIEKSELQIEKAQKDQMLARMDADTKRAEVEAAEVALAKRTIYAPFSGEVVKLYREKSEWVNPGDPILLLMQFDTLRVEAQVKASEYDRSEMKDKQVTVTIPRARGRKIELTGKVVHVGQLIESGGFFVVRAEIQNTKEGNSWTVQPGRGQRATMSVHLE